MKVKKIHIENYRMLKRIDIDLEENLSLIIGKNNCGKTSFLSMDNLQHAIPEDSDFPIFLGIACKLNKWPLII